MLALLLMLQSAPADILVVGERLSEAQAACVRAPCSPLRDARLSIALAETQFRRGGYRDALRTLGAAVARNRGSAATDPKPVAALYEAYATVALHEGDQAIYQRAVAGQVRTLRENLPATDPAVAAANSALGDMWIKLGDYRQAESSYRAAEREATATGLDAAAMVAGMKRAWLAAAMGRPARARTMLDEIAARPAIRAPGMAAAVRIVRFRIAAMGADEVEIAKLLADIGRQQGAAPALLWAPPFPVDADAAANEGARRAGQPDVVRVASSDIAGIQWIDVGFRIRPDGRTADAEILRGSRSPPWAEAVLRGVEQRRYTASPDAAGSAGPDLDGVYRVERITKRSIYAVPPGSLIRRRTRADGFETLDLTDGRPPAPAGARRS